MMNGNSAMDRISLSVTAVGRMTAFPAYEAAVRWAARLLTRLHGAGPGRIAVNRMRGGLLGVGVWIAFSLAVLTCNGFLGLLAHWVALAGAATLFERTAGGLEIAASRSGGEFCGMNAEEGEATCAVARLKTN